MSGIYKHVIRPVNSRGKSIIKIIPVLSFILLLFPHNALLAGVASNDRATLTCVPPAITGEPASLSVTYGGNASFTVVATGDGLSYQWQEYITGWNDITNGGIYSNATTATLNLTRPSASMSGYKYRCIVTGTCGTAYTDGTAKLTVNKAVLMVVADNKTKVFGEINPPPLLTFQYSGWIGSDNVSDLTILPTSNTIVTVASPVGNYPITVSGGADDNYSFMYVDGIFSVTKAMLFVTADSQTKTYGSANPAILSLQYSGWKNGNGVGDLTIVPTASTTVTVTTPVGTYIGAITVSGGSDDNYDFTYLANDFTITPKPIIVTAIAGQTKFYGAADPAPFTYTFSPALEGTDAISGALGRIAGESVGSYTYTLGSLTAGPNYSISIAATPTFSITGKPILVTATAGQTKVFGTLDPLPFTYTFAPALDPTDVMSGALDRTAGEDVGNYAFTVGTLTAGPNYSLQIATTSTFSITPKQIAVTATTGQTKIYGTSDPVFTYTFSPALIGTDIISGALGRAAGETVGNYAYNIGTLTAGPNYNLTIIATPTFSITKRVIIVTVTAGQTKIYGSADPPVFSYSVTSGSLATGDSFSGALTRVAGETVAAYFIGKGSLTIVQGAINKEANYDMTFVGADFNITKLSAVVTPNDAGKTYGATDPVFTGTLSGFLASDNVTATYSRTAGETVGGSPYTISATLSPSAVLDNYNIVYNTASFTIDKRPITITANPGQSKVYGSADPLPFTYAFAPALEGTDVISGALGRTAGENVGNYAFTIGTLTAGPNYSLLVAATSTFSITPKQITITATTGQSKIYGTPDPVFAYTFAPALEGTDVFGGALGRAAGENVGNYAYNIGTLTAGPNYSLSLTGTSMFNITPRPLVLIVVAGQTKVYGTADPVFDYTVSPALINGDSFTGALSRTAGENIGSYAINQGDLDAGPNYSITLTSNDFTITAKTVTVTATAGLTKFYSAVDPVFTYTFFPALISGDSFTGSLSRTAGENVGIYAYTLGTLSAGTNYTLSISASTTFSITGKPLTVTGASVISKIYDGNTNAFITGAALSGVEPGDIGDVVLGNYTTGTFAIADAGSHIVTTAMIITGAKAGNYTLIQPVLTGTITQIALTVSADNKIKCYDGSVYSPFTVTYIGFVNGETEAVLGGTLVFSGTASTSFDPGTGYVIIPGGLTSVNYNITFQNGDLTINSLPSADAGFDKAICISTSTTIGSAAVTGIIYSWTSVPAGFTSTEANPTVSPLVTTTYTITSNNGICTNTDDVIVTVNPGPTISKNVSDYNGYNIPCYGLSHGSIQVNPTSGQAPYIYSWTGPDGFIATTKDISNLKAGQYILLISDSNSCSATETIVLTEPGKLGMTINLSVSNAGGYNINCAGESTGSIDIEPVNQVKTVNYVWNDGLFGKTRTNLNAGNYNIRIIDSNNCMADSSVTLIQPDSMKLVLDISQLPFCPDKPDGEIKLDVTGGVKGTDYTYLWSDNSTGNSLTNVKEGFYRVTVNDLNGCVIKDSVNIEPINKTCLIIPNAISPNGDLINDVWNIGLVELYPGIEITIFNRWGQTIWRSEKGYPVPWDGTRNGSPLPIDSYHYIIDLHSGSKPTVGNVTIVK
jgi:large repetitive protein